MADFSNASGYVRLIGEWTEKMCDDLNTVKNEWADWRFDISIEEDFSPGLTEADFTGNGRNTMLSTLELIDASMEDSESETEYRALLAEMERLGSAIEFEFGDLIAVAECYAEVKCRLISKDGKLAITELQEKSAGTWEEFFERIDDDAPWENLIDELMDVLRNNGFEEDVDNVKEWAKENTKPGVSGLNYEDDVMDAFG